MLRLWFAVQTQWRRTGMEGVPTGLDYAGVDVVLRQRYGNARKRRGLFADLQTMERAALEAWAEKRAQER